MNTNRSMPDACVIPELAYRDVGKAVEWLCKVFGFELRLRIGDHRAQLDVYGGAVVLTAAGASTSFSDSGRRLGIMVRVDDVDSHYERAFRAGASGLALPTNYPYGERQYSCPDLDGYVWTFSQTLADVAPETWGGSFNQRAFSAEGCRYTPSHSDAVRTFRGNRLG